MLVNLKEIYITKFLSISMKSKPFTQSDLNENREYALNSEHSLGHPDWDATHALSLLQCTNIKYSSDLGWLRLGKGYCFCDMCSRKVGAVHRPACKFHGIVGNLNDVSREAPQAKASDFCCVQ